MIIVRIWEGLGNQMFQYAYARFLSRKGQLVYLDLHKSYDAYFPRDKRQNNRDVAIQNFRITIRGVDIESTNHYKYLKCKTLPERLIFKMAQRGKWIYNFWDEGYARDTDVFRGNCYVKGWFQNPAYLNNIRKILLKEFIPKKRIKITKQLRELLENHQTVSIHIRRGDYVAIHNDLSWDYYAKAIAEMKKYYEDPVFIVFSDDYLWAKQHLNSDDVYYFIDEHECLEDYEQLMVMSRCNSNIIANSTFSWWAAWLNQNKDKNVIMPKRWLKNQEKLIMKEWVKL